MILSTFLALNAAVNPRSSASICAWSLGPAGLAGAAAAAGADAAGAEAGAVAAVALPATPKDAARTAASFVRSRMFPPPELLVNRAIERLSGRDVHQRSGRAAKS